MQATRVQGVSSTVKDAIPDAFIRPEDERPAATTVLGEKLDVPIIDLSDPDEGRIRRSIVEASQKHGMFQVVNHGIPEELIRSLQSVGKQFFELSQEEKETYAKVPGSLEGYGSTLLAKEAEGKKLGWVDHLFHKIWPPSVINYRFWPKNPPTYKKVNEEYAKYLHGVANKLFTNLSLELGLEENELKESVGGDQLEYLMKINYYPPCPRPDLALGVPAHTDMSAITINLPNEVQGLQASADGKWYDVNHVPSALFIHIGDQLEIVSHGRYKSVLHRSTVNKDSTRMSWPVFLEPPQEFVVGPHPKLAKDGQASEYKAKKYKDYAYCKLNKLPQ